MILDTSALKLPALGALAHVRAARGDGWCVVHAMLQAQGKPDTAESVEDCLESAKAKVCEHLEGQCLEGEEAEGEGEQNAAVSSRLNNLHTMQSKCIQPHA